MRIPSIEPTLTFPPELLLAAQGPGSGIRAAIFDVDGVLTDGRIYIGEHGEVQGLLDARRPRPEAAGARRHRAARHHRPRLAGGARRVADLGIAHAVYGVADKLAAAAPLLAQLGLDWDALAAMGDDWPDLPLLSRAGFACAPPNAHAEVRALAHHVTAARGGFGAARECCDLLLMAAGRYADLLRSDLTTLDRSG